MRHYKPRVLSPKFFPILRVSPLRTMMKFLAERRYGLILFQWLMSWRPIKDTFETCDWHPSSTIFETNGRENMPVALCWDSLWSYYGFHILSIIVCGRYWNRSILVHLLIAKGKALSCETVSCWLFIDPFLTARGLTCSKAMRYDSYWTRAFSCPI